LSIVVDSILQTFNSETSPFSRGGGKDTPVENNDRDCLEKQVKEESKSALELIIREGACRMLQAAIENPLCQCK